MEQHSYFLHFDLESGPQILPYEFQNYDRIYDNSVYFFWP